MTNFTLARPNQILPENVTPLKRKHVYEGLTSKLHLIFIR